MTQSLQNLDVKLAATETSPTQEIRIAADLMVNLGQIEALRQRQCLGIKFRATDNQRLINSVNRRDRLRLLDRLL